MKSYRYGDFVSISSHAQREVNFSALTPKAEYDEQGRLKPYHPPPVEVRGLDIQRLLFPYISVRLNEQLRAVIPLAIYLVLFQLLILRSDIHAPWQITAGLLAVIFGLMLFMEGLKKGLMPFGELIGKTLPRKSSLPVVLFITFLLGIGVTLAEPAIGALKAAGRIVNVDRAPYLYLLLNDYSGALVLMVGVGVGIAAVLGTLRFIRGWSLKPMIMIALTPTLLLTAYFLSEPELNKIIGLAWDCGAVTTGPVTVPLVLALGIGVASATGKAGSALSGFGIVTMASLFPILGVLLLGLYVFNSVSVVEILAGAASGVGAVSAGLDTGIDTVTWYNTSPGAEIIGGLRAVLPLVLFLLIVIKWVLKERIPEAPVIAYGVSLALLGMIVFNLGLTYGLAPLGNQSGSLIPAAFTSIEAVESSPLYFYSLGVCITLVFAWLLGFGATVAEPALNALGMTVEKLTNGAFRKRMLLYAVSFGVAFGIALGIIRILTDIPLGYFLIPGYLVAVVLTVFSSEEFVNVAWDSAGVTTGPITVPLVLALGLGLGDVLLMVEGFGILALASIGPIVSVMSVGLWVRWRLYLSLKSETAMVEQEAIEVS